MSHVTNAQAEQIIAAAKHKATEIGISASIAVQDHGGHVVAFSRMDGAFLGSIDVAEKKARTAVLFGRETQDVWKFAKPDGPAHGIEFTNGILVTFPGGIPLRAGDQNLIGAIGVSGGTVDQDYAIAQAGVAALLTK
jgi:uncharacterized protein GlcG (DUF336 family)